MTRKPRKREQPINPKAAAEERLRAARAREIELRIAIDERELVPVEDGNDFLTCTTGEQIAALSGLPAQVTRDLSDRRRIENVINQARNEMCARIKRYEVSNSSMNEDQP